MPPGQPAQNQNPRVVAGRGGPGGRPLLARLAAGIIPVSLALVAGVPALPTQALAGPPFITDDPQPTELHRWEIYNSVGGVIQDGRTSLDAGVDLNYGGLRDVQLTATLPLHSETGQPLDAGVVQLAGKYRFLHQHPGVLSADIAVFPRVFLPTGRGIRRAQLLLPVWAGRDWGKWSLLAGGGYMLNPGVGRRDYWQQGVALIHKLRPGWQLGLEYYGQGRDSADSRSVQGVNLGSIVHLGGPCSWLASFGQGVSRKQTVFYTALKLDL